MDSIDLVRSLADGALSGGAAWIPEVGASVSITRRAGRSSGEGLGDLYDLRRGGRELDLLALDGDLRLEESDRRALRCGMALDCVRPVCWVWLSSNWSHIRNDKITNYKLTC